MKLHTERTNEQTNRKTKTIYPWHTLYAQGIKNLHNPIHLEPLTLQFTCQNKWVSITLHKFNHPNDSWWLNKNKKLTTQNSVRLIIGSSSSAGPYWPIKMKKKKNPKNLSKCTCTVDPNYKDSICFQRCFWKMNSLFTHSQLKGTKRDQKLLEVWLFKSVLSCASFDSSSVAQMGKLCKYLSASVLSFWYYLTILYKSHLQDSRHLWAWFHILLYTFTKSYGL